MFLSLMHAITVVFMIVGKRAYFLLLPWLYFVDYKVYSINLTDVHIVGLVLILI